MRRIVHIDMDCFYAAIEERENPALRGHPVAVGGSSPRSVLTTANYRAREFGVRSAMPVFKARVLCPELVIVPVRFDLYRDVSRAIRGVFRRFTEKIEPLSLDEAYLDISHWQSEAAAVAREIRAQIREETSLGASAGIAPNKMLAKIASDWNKPDGQYEIREADIPAFMQTLPVGRLWGVGPKFRDRLAAMGIHTCGHLQPLDRMELARRFGRWGSELWELCRGIDPREVVPDRIRKSLSCETTFSENLTEFDILAARLRDMVDEIAAEAASHHADRRIRSRVVKVKFDDFRRTTAERAGGGIEMPVYEELLREALARGEGRAVRLLGAGVRFADPEADRQLEFFDSVTAP
jgi:DNA polymerase-4